MAKKLTKKEIEELDKYWADKKRKDNIENQKKGKHFELYVRDLYRDLKKNNVKHDVTYKLMKEGKPIRCQIDLTYGVLDRKYVECKYHDYNPVNLEQITKFVGQLELIGINPKRGVMITNRRFCYVTEVYAKKHGVTLIEGKDLQKMERDRKGFIEKIFYKERPLEKIIEEYKPRRG